MMNGPQLIIQLLAICTLCMHLIEMMALGDNFTFADKLRMLFFTKSLLNLVLLDGC